MKNLRHLTRRQPETIDNAVDAAQSEHLSSSDDGLKKNNQTSASLTETETVADRIRKYCLYILFFVLTSHAVFGEIKNGYEKNIIGLKRISQNPARNASGRWKPGTCAATEDSIYDRNLSGSRFLLRTHRKFVDSIQNYRAGIVRGNRYHHRSPRQTRECLHQICSY